MFTTKGFLEIGIESWSEKVGLSVFAYVCRDITFKQSLVTLNKLVTEWIDRYVILHWRIFRYSYKNLVWVGFESATTEFF